MKTRYTAIVNYGLGNLFSIKNACNFVGLSSQITNSKNEISNANAVILPGVGAFKQAMESLQSLDLIETIINFSKSNRPLLGICLGMQLLFEESQEFGLHDGLGLVKGKVKRFNVASSLKVPHIGWNSIRKVDDNSWDNNYLKNLKNGDNMYFIHSYYCQPSDSSIIKSKTKYGDLNFCSTIIQDNICGMQFHPERSAVQGLAIYKNLKNMIMKKNRL